ncbi:hypothetical protein [Deinococcus sonorensis]|uniref:Lipoprotein n=2 Tax=Deinococcus sonorensis TaxID=309891 RepID=A0AAU7U6Z7_9DEIO
MSLPKLLVLLCLTAILGACTTTVPGVPGTLWPLSGLAIDTHNEGNLQLPCAGGVGYDLTTPDLHLVGTAEPDTVSIPGGQGSLRRGAPYTLVATCLDHTGRETGRSQLTGTVPVNGLIHKPFNQGPSPFVLHIYLRADRSKPQPVVQHCVGRSQGTAAPCLQVEY